MEGASLVPRLYLCAHGPEYERIGKAWERLTCALMVLSMSA